MSTITTEPSSALSTSKAPSTDSTRPSTRAHCWRTPAGPVALPGEPGAGTTTGGVGGAESVGAGGAGAAAGVAATADVGTGAVGGVTTTVVGVVTAGAGAGAGGGGVAATTDGEGA